MNNEGKTFQEEFKVNGEDLLNKIKSVINEGNVRRIIVKNKEGKTVFELPLTLGIVGVLLAPSAAALGAIAALIGECTVVVVKEQK